MESDILDRLNFRTEGVMPAMNVKRMGKKILAPVIAVALVVPSPIASPAAFAAASTSDAVVKFQDAGLEKIVRASLGKTSGTLRTSDLANADWIEIKAGDAVKSLADLSKLPNLTTFWLEGHQDLNLAPLTSAKKLNRLSLQQGSEMQMRSVVPKLTGLRSLYINDAGLKDISFVAPLKKLIYLNVSNNELSDLSPLKGMNQLTQLYADRNQISDIRPLAGLPLRNVYMGGNLIEDASPLLDVKDKKELHTLVLSSNQLKDVSFVLQFPNLNVINMAGNDKASYAPIYPISAKNQLNFPLPESDRSHVITFEDPALEKAVRSAARKSEGALTIADVASITSLKVSGLGIRSLEGLQWLPQLVTLEASGNRVFDLTPLRYLSKLTTLSLKGNPVKDYTPIRDVARTLVSKDFDPGLKVASTVKVSTFMQLVQAAETAQDKQDVSVKLVVDNPALSNYETYSELVYYFYAKYPTGSKAYRYVNPQKAVKTSTKFTFNLGNAEYSAISVSANREQESYLVDASEYEHPVAAANLKAEEDIQSNNAEIKALAQQLTAGAKNDREKMLAIHDWVASNVRYDYDTFNGSKNGKQDALSVLRAKTGVCAGYSQLVAALGRSVGIPVQYVTGHVAKQGSPWDVVFENLGGKQFYHAWNQAYVDGKWIMIDATWDSAGYNPQGEKSRESTRRYFDPNPAIFASNHTYYVPNPSPAGLSDFYFELSESDRSAVHSLGWDQLWKTEDMMGTMFFYYPTGHIVNGEVTALITFRVPAGYYVTYTMERDASGNWILIDRQQADNYLSPTGSFRLAKY